MQRAVQQFPLPERIPTLKEMVISARSQKETAAKAEAEYLDLLAQAEAEIGNQEIERSGLIAEGENPYQATGIDPEPEPEGGTTAPPADAGVAEPEPDSDELPPGASIAPQDRAVREKRSRR